MFKRIRELLDLINGTPVTELPPADIRSHGLVPLSAWERKHFAQTARCPDCVTGQLQKGPRGGCSVNVRCPDCGARFNVTVVLGTLIDAERIGEAIRKVGYEDDGDSSD